MSLEGPVGLLFNRGSGGTKMLMLRQHHAEHLDRLGIFRHGEPDALTSRGVEIGEKAPDFTLPSTKDGKFRLSDNAGKKAVIVQFYVLDFTPT